MNTHITRKVEEPPWLRWNGEKLRAGMPKQVKEYHGLYRERLHPEGTPQGTDGWWEVSDEESARLAVEDMIRQLERAGWPTLEAMFSRESLLTRLRAGDLGLMKGPNFGANFAMAEALILMDDGPSDALEAKLAYLLDDVVPDQIEEVMRFGSWVLTQAAMA